MDENKSLSLMKFWLFGTFLIISVATTIFLGQFLGLAVFKLSAYWFSMVAVAVFVVVSFYLYRWYIQRNN